MELSFPQAAAKIVRISTQFGLFTDRSEQKEDRLEQILAGGFVSRSKTSKLTSES